jgi:hypothetical protein
VNGNIGHQLNLAQKTLDGLYNKSHERFMLSKCPENAPMDHKRTIQALSRYHFGQSRNIVSIPVLMLDLK